MIGKLNNSKISAEFLDNDESLLLGFDVNGYSVSFLLEFSHKYPFDPPELKLVSSYGLESLTDISKSDSALELILGETWLPVKSLNDVIESLNLYVQQAYKPLEKSLMLDIFNVQTRCKVPLLVLLILVLRVFVINMPQMDWNSLPDYGPYEQARNSMAVAFNFKVEKWYLSKVYQKIKDPPLFAYFSAGSSFFCQFFDEESLSEVGFAGYQSVGLKTFMRISVIFWELLMLFLPVLLFFRYFYKNLSVNVQIVACGLVMCSPGLILTQHVFFSYCGISTGMVVWAVLLILKEKLQWACFALALALGFSMDSLLPVLVLFVVIVTLTFVSSVKKSRKINQHRILIFLTEFTLGILSCCLAFSIPLLILALPWLSTNSLSQLFNTESITTIKSPTLLTVLRNLLGFDDSSVLMLQCSSVLILQIPLFFILPKQKSSHNKVFIALLTSLLSFSLFLSTLPLSLIFSLTLFFSLFTIVSSPETFRLVSISLCFILYPQTSLDNSRFGYFFLTTSFFLLTHHYIHTVNYLQNRSTHSKLNCIYLSLLLVHITELFSPDLFTSLHKPCSILSLILTYSYTLYSSYTQVPSSSQFYTEKKFRNKNKNS